MVPEAYMVMDLLTKELFRFNNKLIQPHYCNTHSYYNITLTLQVPLSEEIESSKKMLHWRIGTNMPNHMNYYPDAVVINRSQVYVGAGSTYDFREREQISGSIPILQCQQHVASGPTFWATFNNRWLIAAGGYNENEGPLTTVEVLDILSCCWYCASPLPIEQFKMSSAITGKYVVSVRWISFNMIQASKFYASVQTISSIRHFTSSSHCHHRGKSSLTLLHKSPLLSHLMDACQQLEEFVLPAQQWELG